MIIVVLPSRTISGLNIWTKKEEKPHPPHIFKPTHRSSYVCIWVITSTTLTLLPEVVPNAALEYTNNCTSTLQLFVLPSFFLTELASPPRSAIYSLNNLSPTHRNRQITNNSCSGIDLTLHIFALTGRRRTMGGLESRQKCHDPLNRIFTMHLPLFSKYEQHGRNGRTEIATSNYWRSE